MIASTNIGWFMVLNVVLI